MSGENRIAEQVDAVGNRANGVAAHYEYAPFGEVIAQVRQGGVTAYDFAALNPWRFSSEYADDALNLDYYNYRHYEPVMGRWLSKDILHPLGGINVYATVCMDLLGLVRITNELFFGGDVLQAIEQLEKIASTNIDDASVFAWNQVGNSKDVEPVIVMVQWEYDSSADREAIMLFKKVYDVILEHELQHIEILKKHRFSLKDEFISESSSCLKENIASKEDLEIENLSKAGDAFVAKKEQWVSENNAFQREDEMQGRHRIIGGLIDEYKKRY